MSWIATPLPRFGSQWHWMSPQELFGEAIRLENEGQRELALDVFRQLTETSPTRNVFLRLASLSMDLGLPDDAVRAFERALEIDGRCGVALMELGILAIRRRDFELAETHLKRACEITEHPGGFSLLGVALRHRGKALEAEEACRHALRIDPKYEEAHYNLGVILRHDRRSEAEASFRTALELDPGFACAHRELGFVLAHGAPNPEAEAHLRRAIELDPGDAWAHIYLGTYLWSAGVAAAVAEFRTAAQLKPRWAVPLWSLGNIHEDVLGDFDSAQSYFERALELQPDSQEALKGLGRLIRKRGRKRLAIDGTGSAQAGPAPQTPLG